MLDLDVYSSSSWSTTVVEILGSKPRNLLRRNQPLHGVAPPKQNNYICGARDSRRSAKATEKCPPQPSTNSSESLTGEVTMDPAKCLEILGSRGTCGGALHDSHEGHSGVVWMELEMIAFSQVSSCNHNVLNFKDCLVFMFILKRSLYFSL